MQLHILRHAHAGDPVAWEGPDATRPYVFAGHVLLLTVAGVALRAMNARGPLEAMVGAASRAARDRVRGSAPTGTGPP